MNKDLQEQIIKRLKSFLWRAGAFVTVAGLSALVDILGIAKVDPLIITIVSLVAGEITKFLNQK
jgi:hypothetical protein